MSPTDTNATVRELFDKHRDLISLPVVDGNHPLGLIKRHTFQSEMAKPFRRELHERKSCMAFMDAGALVVEAATTIEQTTMLVVNSQKNALADGFLIARSGEFVGVGYGLDLMRTVADMQQARNRQILQSIDYASVIQRAMLRTSQETMSATLPDAAIVWEPRDIVGGDFFLCAKSEYGIFVAIVDCTGHGVPGAFMTLISSSWLGQSLEREGPSDPAALLSTLNRKIKQSLGQIEHRDSGEQSDDGLDAIFLWLNQRDKTLTYAGSRVPLYSLKAGADHVTLHESDRIGVGYVSTPLEHRWQNRTIAFEPDDLLFVTTDGLTDQVGGPRNIAFGKRRLRETILQSRYQPATEQVAAIMSAHRRYQGEQRRRDDLTLFCLRVLREAST